MKKQGSLVTKGIEKRLEILRLIMDKRPGAITNNNLKWFLRLSKKYSEYGKMTPRQFDVLKDITTDILNKVGIEKEF